MPAILWSFIMPLTLGTCAAVMAAKFLFADRFILSELNKAREVIMSERELEKARENRMIRWIMKMLHQMQRYIDLDYLLINDLQKMLDLMGTKKRAEQVLAGFLLYGFIGAAPVLILPALTGFAGYFVLYPLLGAFLVRQKYSNLQKQYRKWQTAIIKDMPELIDKLRISFASGRDYIAAFIQVRENSGSRMKHIIDGLINDLQYMRAAQALDKFAEAFRMPVVSKFASAVKIAVEHGYEAAENYFSIIEKDITEVRRVAITELTKSKPEKVYQLYIVLISLAVGALLLKGWEIFSEINKIM